MDYRQEFINDLRAYFDQVGVFKYDVSINPSDYDRVTFILDGVALHFWNKLLATKLFNRAVKENIELEVSIPYVSEGDTFQFHVTYLFDRSVEETGHIVYNVKPNIMAELRRVKNEREGNILLQENNTAYSVSTE